MLSDIEIAQSAKLKRIDDLAHEWGLEDSEFEPYGWDKAKLTLNPERKADVALLRDSQGRLLLARHPGERLLAGFWELPALDALPFSLPMRPLRLGQHRQTFSHFRQILTVFHVTPPPTPPPLPDVFTWCADPAALPLTTATRKILARFPLPPTH